MTDTSGDVFDVGQRLLELRRRAGLSQRARRRAPMFPMPRSRRSNPPDRPSIASLRRILGGLGLSMAEFFEPERKEADQVFFRTDELVDLTSELGRSDLQGEPMIIMRQIGNALAHGLQIMHERYLPGADTGETLLEHPAHEGALSLRAKSRLPWGRSAAFSDPAKPISSTAACPTGSAMRATNRPKSFRPAPRPIFDPATLDGARG
jgi:transcriptional regulator with XRE-family HTH domain